MKDFKTFIRSQRSRALCQQLGNPFSTIAPGASHYMYDNNINNNTTVGIQIILILIQRQSKNY